MQGVGLAEQISVMIKTGEGRRRHLGHWVLLRPGGHSGQGLWDGDSLFRSWRDDKKS